MGDVRCIRCGGFITEECAHVCPSNAKVVDATAPVGQFGKVSTSGPSLSMFTFRAFGGGGGYWHISGDTA